MSTNGDVSERYLLAYAQERAKGRAGFRVLDWGCGGAALTQLLRANGIDCYGADVFYAGANRQDEGLTGLLDDEIVRVIPESGELPFSDGFFDLVLSNQVIEHVHDLQTAAGELDRVLAQDGGMLHHFPTYASLREVHLGIPLVHHMPRNRWRYRYVVACRTLGLGSYKSERGTRREWARARLDWIDRYTAYRTRDEVVRAFPRSYRVAFPSLAFLAYRLHFKSPFLVRLVTLPGVKVMAERAHRAIGGDALELWKSA